MHSPELIRLAKNLCADDENLGSLPWEMYGVVQHNHYYKRAEEILFFILREPEKKTIKTVADRHNMPVPLVQAIWREIVDLMLE